MATLALPPKVKVALKPVLASLHAFALAAEPVVAVAYAHAVALWEAAQPYHPEELVPAFGGLVLLFFGGTFVTTIAAFEAFRQTGWEGLVTALKTLHMQHTRAADASKKDDQVDADGDGVADVKQISKDQLAVRKLAVFAKAVDPEKVGDAITSITTGMLAVTAALRAHFAKAIALGATLGDNVHKVASHYLEAPVLEAAPAEYKKWVAPGIKWASKLAGIFMAWILARIISAFHSSVRGAEMALRGGLKYAVRHKYCQPITENEQTWNVAVCGLAFIGFWTQLYMGFYLPFPLNVLLIPVRVLEWSLTTFIAGA